MLGFMLCSHSAIDFALHHSTLINVHRTYLLLQIQTGGSWLCLVLIVIRISCLRLVENRNLLVLIQFSDCTLHPPAVPLRHRRCLPSVHTLCRGTTAVVALRSGVTTKRNPRKVNEIPFHLRLPIAICSQSNWKWKKHK